MFFSNNGVRTGVGANNEYDLVQYAEHRNLDTYEIFKNNSGFHSTTQEEHLVKWKGNDKSYWGIQAKLNPELLRKRVK